MTQVIDALLLALKKLLKGASSPDPTPLPEGTAPLPKPNVSLVSVTEKTVGLGNRVGDEIRDSLGVAALRGVRLDAVVRFQVWGRELYIVDREINQLHGRLLSAKDQLRAQGFLQLAAEETSLGDFLPSLNGWRKTTNYRVLYEFRYPDRSDAGLISQIPIHINSEYQESTTVTDAMLRWDEHFAAPLILRGPARIQRLPLLFFAPATLPTGAVTLTRTFDGATGSPTVYSTLAEFHNAVGGAAPINRHGQITFASLSDYLAEFGAADTVTFGDWDENHVPDDYVNRILTFEPAIQLVDAGDYFQVSYQDAAFDHVAVLYLRVLSR